MSREKKKKRNIWPGVILAAFVSAMATFFILLQMEKNVLSDYEKVTVWCAGCELAEGLEITEQGLTDWLEQVEMDKKLVPGNAVTDKKLLSGLQTKVMISKGTVLTASMFTGEKEYISGLYQPVIAGCKSDDLFQLVSGILRKGDRIHIYTVNEELGETYLLWENVMVYQAFDNAGNMIASEDMTTPAARVNLLLEEGYAEQFYNELYQGSLRVVKVWE